MPDNDSNHWERVYSQRGSHQHGWFTPHLRTSLDWIRALGLPPGTAVLDVGGGASTLVDDLLRQGFRDITVLDIAPQALAQTRNRLGTRAMGVTFLQGDITTVELPGRYGLWHDRAVFHFLTGATQRRAYRDRLLRALAPGAHAIIGTFAPAAPPTCSGLPVRRYDAAGLHAELGPGLDLEREHQELHVTPGGVKQLYLYCQFRRVSAA